MGAYKANHRIRFKLFLWSSCKSQYICAAENSHLNSSPAVLGVVFCITATTSAALCSDMSCVSVSRGGHEMGRKQPAQLPETGGSRQNVSECVSNELGNLAEGNRVWTSVVLLHLFCSS